MYILCETKKGSSPSNHSTLGESLQCFRSFREKTLKWTPKKIIYQRSEGLSLLPHMSTHKLEQLKLALRLLVMNA